MSYYLNFPKILYKINPALAGQKSVVDILQSAKIVDFFTDRSNSLYVDYIVPDGEKPEHLAYKVYGKSDYHWVILLSNSIVNPFFDWPLSTSELEEQVQSLYSGTAVFFDPFDNVSFKIKNSTTILPVSSSHFVVGNNVYQQNGNITVSGVVKEWNPTLRKLVISDVSSSSGINFNKAISLYSDNIDGITFETIEPSSQVSQRVVDDNTYALHHFVDDYGNQLDPYGNIDVSALESDNKIYTRENIFNTTKTTKNTALNRYIGDLTNEFDRYVVTNRQYESNVNDKKRRIKILRTEYLNTVVEQLGKLF